MTPDRLAGLWGLNENFIAVMGCLGLAVCGALVVWLLVQLSEEHRREPMTLGDLTVDVLDWLFDRKDEAADGLRELRRRVRRWVRGRLERLLQVLGD